MNEGLFHLSVKMVQRSKGRSATGAIAYRAGENIVDERTNLRFDYTRKTGVSRSVIFLPADAPEQFKERSVLWNAVEQRETRKNSAVAREFEIALPYDLPREVREDLGLNFCQYLVDELGVAADISFHDPHPRDTDGDSEEPRNFHAHILTSTRVLTQEGFIAKIRALDSAATGGKIIETIRAKFAEMINSAYAAHNVDKYVDERSYERRGIEQVPQIHVGVNQAGERAEQNAAIIAANARIAQIQHEATVIKLQINALIAANNIPKNSSALFAPEPVKDEPRLSSMAERAEQGVTDARELKKTDLLSPVVGRQIATCGESPVSTPERRIITFSEKECRLEELQQMKREAGYYGRAIQHLRDQSSLATSFQRELDNLECPNIMHRLLVTKRWQVYEKKRTELNIRVRAAKERVQKLQALANRFKASQTRWDEVGYAEHKALAKELSPEPKSTFEVSRTHSKPSYELNLLPSTFAINDSNYPELPLQGKPD